MLRNCYDLCKRGTIIVSAYRSGTHFLQNSLSYYLKQFHVKKYGEVDELPAEPSDGYSIYIANSPQSKFNLLKCDLSDYHVVLLTRDDVVAHWISYHIWMAFNTHDDRFLGSNLPHHGGTASLFEDLPMVEQDLGLLQLWLMEKFMANLVPADAVVDYSDLSSISSLWSPNEYNKTLDQLFVNHNIVKTLLTGFKVSNVKK